MSSACCPEVSTGQTGDEIARRFGYNATRRRLLEGMRSALENLKTAGCATVYIDGSFVTAKELPNDYDACWEENGVDAQALDPVLLIFDAGRATQKAKYLGELFPAAIAAGPEGLSFFQFFQRDKETGRRKGIVAVSLGEWDDQE